MTRIERVFKRLRDQGRRPALIPFTVAGDPDLKTTEAIVLKMAECGADMIEIGVPFSDPLADGPTIQAAHQRALRNGIALTDIFHLTEKLKRISRPVVLMTYFNPVFQYGLKNFAKDCQRSGVDGVILPDLPLEEAGPWIQEARKTKLDTIFLVAPTSPPSRIRTVARRSRGFIYYVSVTGLTGVREKLPAELGSAIERIRRYTKKPVAVGFGISTPEQAKMAGRYADGVIVGSAIVTVIEENLQHPEMIRRVGDIVSSFARSLEPHSLLPGPAPSV